MPVTVHSDWPTVKIRSPGRERYPFKVGPWSSHSLVTQLAGPGNGKRLLDVGCARGELLSRLAAKGWLGEGVEPNLIDANVAKQRGLVVHSVDFFESRQLLSPPYDLVVAADVIEHLPDPQAFLSMATTLLTPRGRLIISVPNVAHLAVRLPLLFGSFTYRDRGPLDRTHLRFFTVSSIKQEVEAGGFSIASIYFAPAPLEVLGEAAGLSVPDRVHALNALTARLWPGGLAYQTILEASPRCQ